MPDVRVQAAFGADLTADPGTWSWTEVANSRSATESVRTRLANEPFTITRGTADEGSKPTPTTTTLRFSNVDGALTPRNAASAWYPYVRRGTPLRISVWHDSAWQIRFTGEIASVAPEWPQGDNSGPDPDEQPAEAHVRIEAAGVLRRINQWGRTESTLYRRTLNRESGATVLVGYWPLEDGVGTTHPGSAVEDGFDGSVTGATFQSDSTLPASKPLPHVDNGGFVTFYGDVKNAGETPSTWHAQILVKFNGDWTTKFVLLAVNATGHAAQYEASIVNDDLTLTLYSATGAVLTSNTWDVTDAYGHWCVLRVQIDNSNNTSTVILYALDTADLIIGDGVAIGGEPGRVLAVGLIGTVSSSSGLSFGHLSVFNSGIIVATDPAFFANEGQPAAQRILTLCENAGIPCDIATLAWSADTSEPMGYQLPKPITTLLAECQAADMGILAELLDEPGLTYRYRDTLYNQTPQLTLSAPTQIVPPLSAPDDDQKVRNDVTVTREGGASGHVAEEDITEGVYEFSTTVNLETDQQTVPLAGWHLHLGTWPDMRVPEITIDLVNNPELVDAWLAFELGDRILVEDLPTQHPGDIDVLALGYAETIGDEDWSVQFNCVPAGPYTVGTLDDSTPSVSLARLDSDGSTLASSRDTDDTSLSVTVVGPLWTTSSAYRPFDIVIGGEQMTVTNVTGGSSPQTFTVTRSVNGVVKSHSAGAEVHVAHGLVLAF